MAPVRPMAPPPLIRDPPHFARLVGSEGCAGTESNCRHGDFQSPALPTELPARRWVRDRLGSPVSYDSAGGVSSRSDGPAPRTTPSHRRGRNHRAAARVAGTVRWE